MSIVLETCGADICACCGAACCIVLPPAEPPPLVLGVPPPLDAIELPLDFIWLIIPAVLATDAAVYAAATQGPPEAIPIRHASTAARNH